MLNSIGWMVALAVVMAGCIGGGESAAADEADSPRQMSCHVSFHSSLDCAGNTSAKDRDVCFDVTSEQECDEWASGFEVFEYWSNVGCLYQADATSHNVDDEPCGSDE